MTLKTVVNPKYQIYNNLLCSLPSDFDSMGQVLHSGRNQVREVIIDGIPLIIKRFQRPNVFKQLQYIFARTGKAKKAYKFANSFSQCGISTPEAIGYVLVKDGWKVSDSYFVSTLCPGESLQEIIDPAHPDEEILTALAAEIANAHQKKLMHGDLNLSNIYCQRCGKNIKIHFIDINRSTQSKHALSKRQCATNMLRLTHHEPLLWKICLLYAAQRGWDGEEFARLTLSKMRKFERRKTFLGFLKGKKVDFSGFQKMGK